MRKPYKERRGSISIIAILVFFLLISSASMMLYFASIQSSLSKNQLANIQSKYDIESHLLNLVYSEENFKENIVDHVFNYYRKAMKLEEGKYGITFNKESDFYKHLKDSNIEIKNIEGKEVITINISSKSTKINSTLKAYGSLIGEVFELEKPYLDPQNLETYERKLVESFIKRLEEENWDYDRCLNPALKSMVIATKEDLCIRLVNDNKTYPLISSKKAIKNFNMANEINMDFTSHPSIIHLKRENETNKTITIGDCEDDGLIKMNGVLYIEGDLIINQDFEFLGLIIMNNGNIIVNSKNKAIVKGMIINKGENLDMENIDLIHNKKMIYKFGSYLPGFIDIDIKVIKKF